MRRKFFVSQTPELKQMADVVIDLVALTKGRQRRAPFPSSHMLLTPRSG
jgi:hypothetical protein